ncbi:hypothetical protein BLA29_001520 [Euroglyphus maynei]|uniref:TOG domain-containing protein n=1 Tax=Euroglyphus maynei TaxID=6958 RepID=A0A1Y3BBZ1_EURMA|nr:hypothetical protein BLA29_001520 [Euroglyphus maynei]
MDDEDPVRIAQQCEHVTNSKNDNKLSKPGKPLSMFPNDQNNKDYTNRQRLITTENPNEEEEQNQKQEAEQLTNLLFKHNNSNEDEKEITKISQEDESSVYSNDIGEDQRYDFQKTNYEEENLAIMMRKTSGYNSGHGNPTNSEHLSKVSGGDSTITKATTQTINNNSSLNNRPANIVNQNNPKQQHQIKQNSHSRHHHHQQQQHSNQNRSTNQSSISNSRGSNHVNVNPTRQVTFANGYRNENNSTVVGQIAKKPTSLSILRTQDSPGSTHTNRTVSSDEGEIVTNQNRSCNTKNNQRNQCKETINRREPSSNDRIDNKMAAATSTSNFVPQGSSLASLAQLDADTLANIEYIPTMKDYLLPYYHPYYHDQLYHPATFAAAAATTSPILYPQTAAASLITNPHLLRFGIFPRVLIYQALSSIAEEQFAAVQALVRIVRDAPNEHLLLLLPHMDEFLSVFVSQLLLDSSSNFKVILWTLDIIELLTERFKLRIHPNLSQLVLLLSQRLGDNRIVIRDSVIKVFHQMMTRYCPQEMLDLLFKHVSSSAQHQQPLAFTSASKLREEMANRVTASIATFPRSRLNLPKLCFDIAPFLIDRRSLVRLAALECVATLAQALGPHKLGSLMTAVHSLETSLTAIDLDRLIASIQARLARRSLPRVGPDGNVQYVLRVPTSSDSWYYRRIYDADLEWIALGPTTPPINVPLLNTPTIGLTPKFSSKNSEDLSTESSEPSRTNDSSPAALKPETCQERMAIQQQGLLNSPDSEDIPPPVRSKITVGGAQHHRPCHNRSSTSPEPDAHKSVKIRSRSRSKPQSKQHSSSRKTINPDGMAQDPPSPFRNFSDRQQQRELEQRFHSLEAPQLHRSKTSQEFRPYGKHRTRRDQFIERLVRGESVDDSDLADAQWFRRSSTESLEAWRQYFGRFKKQMADMSLLNGPGRPYGSRPGSSSKFIQ